MSAAAPPEPEPPEPLELMWEGRYIRALRRGRWEYVSRARGIGAVVILAEVDGRILLVEQQRVPVGGPCLELPAGLIGDEEQVLDLACTAIKELEEETGFTAQAIEPLGEFHSSPGMVAESFTLVRAHGLRRIGPGGGTGDEAIIVHQVGRRDIADFIAGRRAAGVAIDVRLLLLLGPALL